MTLLRLLSYPDWVTSLSSHLPSVIGSVSNPNWLTFPLVEKFECIIYWLYWNCLSQKLSSSSLLSQILSFFLFLGEDKYYKIDSEVSWLDLLVFQSDSTHLNMASSLSCHTFCISSMYLIKFVPMRKTDEIISLNTSVRNDMNSDMNSVRYSLGKLTQLIHCLPLLFPGSKLRVPLGICGRFSKYSWEDPDHNTLQIGLMESAHMWS